MTQDAPSDDKSGKKNQKIAKLHERFDPPEKFPVQPEDAGHKRSQKQPGQDLSESHEES